VPGWRRKRHATGLNERGDDEQAPDVGQMSDLPGKLPILG
jgi:hypothetical protein